MRFRPAIFAWCLLLGATLAMAAAAWWLLGREADRVESLAAGTLANRTATVADSIDLLMQDIRSGVEEGVRVMSESDDSRMQLAELVANNPYVVAGFHFRSTDAVTAWYGERGELPAPGALYSKDRSAPQYPWSLPEVKVPQQVVPNAAPLESAAPSDAYGFLAQEPLPLAAVDADDEALPRADVIQQEVAAKNVALKEQRAAVRQASAPSSFDAVADFFGSGDKAELEAVEVDADMGGSVSLGADAGFADVADPFLSEREAKVVARKRADPPVALSRRGWESILVGDEGQWLFWGELENGEAYVGAWLDRSAILAELSKAISLSQQDGLRVQLRDSSDRVVAGVASSRYESSSLRAPDLSLAVGSSLPGWQIETFRANDVNAFGQSFRWVGGVFIVGLSLAILLGSTVLIWQARRDAREAERKTTFVANVSHELKTPLTSIRLFADMLHEGRVKDAAKQKAYLQTMLNETQRLTRLVNNVLDFSRLERGQHKANVVRVDLCASVEQIVATQRERLQADGLEVVCRIPDQPVDAEIDPDALEQILLNLLDNAAKYASLGERAEVVLENEAGGWSLSVKDFGPGIPASERKRVFEAFHRVDERLTSERPGCGLGLSISARLASEMGGRLRLEDNQPMGCIFTLTVQSNAT